MGEDDQEGKTIISKSRRKKLKKRDRARILLQKQKKPGKFRKHLTGVGLAIIMLIMIAINVWIVSLYMEQGLPLFFYTFAVWGFIGFVVGIIWYWEAERHSSQIRMGTLPIMSVRKRETQDFIICEWKNDDGEILQEKWEGGRVGGIEGWPLAHGGGKRGYYLCKVPDNIWYADMATTPPTLIKEMPKEAGFEHGDTYYIPMDFSPLIGTDNLKDELKRYIEKDPYYHDMCRIYIAEYPLPITYMNVPKPGDMETKLEDRNAEVAELRDEIEELYMQFGLIHKVRPTKVVTKKE